ncbi:MAG: MFS transporter [Actinobacteria bacterium]|nr:MFS transporter [Actinomycetota bacterium]
MSIRHRLGALQEQRFRLLWTAQSFSSLGDSMVLVAVPFAALQIGGSPTAVGLVFAANLVPRIALMLVGGVWADRLPRQHVMIAADLIRGLGQAAGAFVLLTGVAELWQLAFIAAIHGSGAAFFTPAASGFIPETVSQPRLQQANALIGISRNVFAVVGPALAGILVHAFGPGWVYGIDAATFALSASFLVRLPAGRPRTAHKNFVADLVEGWRQVTARSWVWASILYFAVWNFATAAFLVLGPVVSDRELGGARDWGLILSGGAIGSVVGSLLALRLRPRRPLFIGYLLISGAALQPILLVRPFPVLVIAAAGFLAWVTLAFTLTLWQTALQERIPREALSRVVSYDWLGSLVLMPVGFVVAGPLAEAIGIDATLWLAAGLLFFSSVAVALAPGVRRITQRGEAPPLREVEVEPVAEASLVDADPGVVPALPTRPSHRVR